MALVCSARPCPRPPPRRRASAAVLRPPDRRAPDPAAGFPAEAAARRIAIELERLDAGAGDLALTQGAAGGDLLFAEACIARGVPVRLLLPLPEREFIERSMLPLRRRRVARRTRLHSPEGSGFAPHAAASADAVLNPPGAGGRSFRSAPTAGCSIAGARLQRPRAAAVHRSWDGAGGDGRAAHAAHISDGAAPRTAGALDRHPHAVFLTACVSIGGLPRPVRPRPQSNRAAPHGYLQRHQDRRDEQGSRLLAQSAVEEDSAQSLVTSGDDVVLRSARRDAASAPRSR